ncbi:hypothetical protein [Pelagicoccus sp. SDUM812003]|uniref:hypothetical protein n=1 Tax=Pelagicoccus sp. SDUM812003 TaxID=3041267 RepID=UPI00280FB54C|nr:hypothetical protein [Pelagicoccus sp. SDUM812003]MDQ8202111.1 hypothetical protein [Pelagicoccus sp. SDUM812003]
MKSAPLAFLFSLLFLVACGVGPEPESLEGEENAAAVVNAFLRALEAEDFDKAKQFLYSKPDYILRDLAHCRDLFFSEEATGISVMQVGHEEYGHKWQIFVDVKINYGPRMKQLHFVLAPDEIPKLRGVNPIVPIDP